MHVSVFGDSYVSWTINHGIRKEKMCNKCRDLFILAFCAMYIAPIAVRSILVQTNLHNKIMK